MKIILKFVKLIRLFPRLSLISFLEMNFLRKNINRNRKCFHIFPYKNTVFDLKQSSNIILNGNLFLNTYKLKKIKG